MKNLLCFLIVLLFIVNLNAQTVREFRLGVWAVFPWVNPNLYEQNYISEINLNHMAAWLLNPNPELWPAEYQNYYGASFSTSNIRWVEREWMNYFNSTYATGDNVGMYIGYKWSLGFTI